MASSMVGPRGESTDSWAVREEIMMGDHVMSEALKRRRFNPTFFCDVIFLNACRVNFAIWATLVVGHRVPSTIALSESQPVVMFPALQIFKLWGYRWKLKAIISWLWLYYRIGTNPSSGTIIRHSNEFIKMATYITNALIFIVKSKLQEMMY